MAAKKSKVSEKQIIEDLFAELKNLPLRTFPALWEAGLDAPDRQGVYVIYDPRGRVLHVGRTTSARGGIRQGLRDHMANASSFTTQYLKGDGGRLRGRYTYRALAVRNRRHRALLEAYATSHLCPAHLGLG